MRAALILTVTAIAIGFFMFLPVGLVGLQRASASIAPLPEPSSIILLGLGVAGLARYLRNRK